MILNQQTPNCSDFDVTLTGDNDPSFRVLLPEAIRAKGLDHGGLHTVPGIWDREENGIKGCFQVADALEISVLIEAHIHNIHVTLTLRNMGCHDIKDVWTDICASLNHLPGDPGWCNRRFLPSVILDRTLQGQYWFEHLTPHRLLALTDAGWVPMHPYPERPDASRVPLYSFVPSEKSDARACAVQSPDGEAYFFQAWSGSCRYCTPCPGNACMHLMPLVAQSLGPEASASIYGMVGIHFGDQKSLVEKLGRFHRKEMSG